MRSQYISIIAIDRLHNLFFIPMVHVMLFDLKASRVVVELMVGQEVQVGKASVGYPAHLAVKVRLSFLASVCAV